MKIVLNKCHGGFSISLKACQYMADRGHNKAKAKIDEYNNQCSNILKSLRDSTWYGFSDVARDDPLLVEAVENLGEEANGSYAELVVVNFDVNRLIHEDESGVESLALLTPLEDDN